MAYSPVTFNEGAPLDPKALNDLQTSVTTAYTQSMNVVNSSGGIQYVPTIDCGSLEVDVTTANTPGKSSFTLNENFTDPSKIRVSATIVNGLGKDEQVTVSVAGLSSGPTVWVNSNKVRKYTVHWTAIMLKSV